MFRCAQIDSNGRVHTVCDLAQLAEGDSIIPIEPGEENVLGRKFRNGKFYGLFISAPKMDIATGEQLLITLSWLDLNGMFVEDDSEINVACQGVTEVVTAQNGQAEIVFESEVPGNYRIEARCTANCWASLEVRVL